MNSKAKMAIKIVGLSAMLILGPAGVAAAQQGIELDEAVVVHSQVVGVDAGHRVLTVVGPREEILQVKVSDDVKNFDKIKVGDELTVTFYQSVALYIGKPGTQPEVDVETVMGRAPEGGKPGGYEIGFIDVSAEVMGIDREHRILTLELPDGHVTNHQVAKSAEGFDQLRVHDIIHARVTRAIAISVESP